MPDNEYFKVQYRILNALYMFMQEGIPVNPDAFGPDVLGIPEAYRLEVIANMMDEGLVKGGKLKRYINADAVKFSADNIKITTAGVDYLKENSNMKKVYNFLHGIKEIIPGA